MEATRYFDAMHNAMSTRSRGAQLLVAVRLQDSCGNDAYLELKRRPGEEDAVVCYSTIGRRGLNFQLFRTGWLQCHNAQGQLTGQFPSSAQALLDTTDLSACCRQDRLDPDRTGRVLRELDRYAGTDYAGPIPQNPRTGAQITVESFVGCGARWTYWSEDAAPCLPVAAILYWLADFLAGSERRLLQKDPRAAELAQQWQSGRDSAVMFRPAAPARPVSPRSSRPVPPCAHSRSWQSILAVAATM